MDPLHSPSWYRVAELRPRLAHEARFHRHRYRDEIWWVVRDPASGRVLRLTPAIHGLVAALDGSSSVQDAWERADARFGDAAPTRDEALAALAALHGAGLLRGDVNEDTATLFRRVDDEARRERRGRRNPIAFRVPLVDPDDFLGRWLPWVAPLYSRAGVLLFCAIVAAAGVLALKHAPELRAGASALLEPESWLAFWLAYPVVKAIHELGHAFAVKRWGGEVHELGVLFLVFMPVPYVDASAASVFPEKGRRMAVGAAGIAVELFLASLALFVWLLVEPGFVQQLAYAVMLVGGISTLLFNGNPLLRFDGYHVLADAVEIPNLGSRANQYTLAQAKRRLLGMREVPLPDTAPGEPPWLLVYAVASNLYGTAIMLGIALYLASRFLAVGVALALFTLAVRLGSPLIKLVAFLARDPAAGERRARVLGGVFSAVAVLAVVLFVLPLPLRTRAHGVVWLPEQAHLRAGVEGFVVEVVAEPHAPVRRGDPLLRVRDAALEAALRAHAAERDAVRLRVDSFAHSDRVRAAVERERLADAEARLARARERGREVWVRAGSDGIFVPRDGRDLLGRHVVQGESVGWVVDLADATVRVVVTQDEIGLLRERTDAAWVRVAHDLGRVWRAEVAREVTAATDRLPTPALGTAGGGPFAVDPVDPDGVRALESVFQFDLALPPGAIVAAGERVHVRFDHGFEPAAPRVWRRLRLLLQRQIGV